MFIKNLAVIAFAVLLSGCYTTSEMAVSSNQHLLDIDAQGLIFTSGIDGEVVKRAAAITKRRGFTHFTIAEYARQDGTSVQTIGGIAQTRYRPGYATTTVIPMIGVTPTSARRVLIQMYHPGEPIPPGAYQVSAVLG